METNKHHSDWNCECQHCAEVRQARAEGRLWDLVDPGAMQAILHTCETLPLALMHKGLHEPR